MPADVVIASAVRTANGTFGGGCVSRFSVKFALRFRASERSGSSVPTSIAASAAGLFRYQPT